MSEIRNPELEQLRLNNDRLMEANVCLAQTVQRQAELLVKYVEASEEGIWEVAAHGQE